MRLLLIVTFVLISCTSEPVKPVNQTADQPVDSTVAETSEPSDTAPAKPAEPQREITIEEVDVANPIVVKGRARTFENNVVVRARGADGKIITETFTTSEGESGQHNPYRATIWLARDPGDRVTIEALEYSAKDGSERSLVSTTKPFTVEQTDVRLFVPDADCNGVHPVSRRAPKSVAIARLLVEMLIAEPQPFPEGSRVNSVILRDGVITVDFNERLQNVGGSCAAQMIRAATTKTLQQLPSVKRVVITAGGSEKLALQP